MCVGGVRDGHGENVRESQKQVHYDYKNLLGGMMRKFSWMLSALLVLAGHGAEITTEGEEAKAVVETEPLLPDEITWDRDGSKMVLIPVVLLNCPIIPQGLR